MSDEQVKHVQKLENLQRLTLMNNFFHQDL
jgi:hypothetical protein